MSDNSIALSGIFSEGYGIIPKKLMRLKLDEKLGKSHGKWVKLVLGYMLSYTGAGSQCFPSIKTIAEDLEISKDTVIQAIKDAEKLNMITKSKLFPNDPLKRANKYTLDFLANDPNIESRQSRIRLDDGSTFQVRTFEQNNNSNNNNSNNNIYTFWNSFSLKKSQENKFLQNTIATVTNKYTLDEIKQAIKNYSTILNSDDYYFTHRWSLCDFLKKGLDKFKDDICFDEYKKYTSLDNNKKVNRSAAGIDWNNEGLSV